MAYHFNPKDIESLEYKDWSFWGTLIITFKSGNKKIIRDMGWDTLKLYRDLKRMMEERK